MIRKAFHFTLYISFSIAILVACAAPTPTLTVTPIPPTATTMSISSTTTPRLTPTHEPEPVKAIINPGDKINGMVFTTDDSFDYDIDLTKYCGFEQDEISTNASYDECLVTSGDRIFIGNCVGVQGLTTEELDKYWPNFSAELTFDDKEINLPAFGSLDFTGDDKMFRVLNILVENITPGKHTFICKSIFQDFPFTSTYVFTVPEQGAPTFTPAPTTTAIATPSITYASISSNPKPGQNPYTSQGELNYLLYVPQDYGKDVERKWPLILFLHGAGERGDDLELVRTTGLPRALENQTDFPFIVASPQLIGTASRDYWSHPAVEELLFGLLKEIQTNLSVDPSHIYLTGLSLGGEGTWDIGLEYPNHFAALVPVAGYSGWPPSVPENICDLKDEPIWAFHGAKDDAVSLDAEQGLVDALKACGGNVKFTVYPDGGHEIWDQAYATPELYAWLLEQTLK